MLRRPAGLCHVVTSDVVAIDYRDLAEAARFIRQLAAENMSVTHLLQAVPMSRSTLERCMRAVLGRSPRAEIVRVKLERAQPMLIETDPTLESIARRTGFRYAPSLCGRFKKIFGQTPREFRAHSKKR